MSSPSCEISARDRAHADALLRIEQLSVEFWNGEEYERVVEDVSLEVRPGEAVGLVGESGCGKTTTAYSVLSYLQPGSRLRSGCVLFEGCDALRLKAKDLRRLRGSSIGHVPQDPTLALNPNIRVGRQITEVLLNHGWRGDRSARARSLLASVGIDAPRAVFRRYPCQLSGGQQQRVMIAMAVACEPKLLVLDEPTTGLDVTSQAMVIELLRQLRATHETSLLYVTHDLGVVAELCDRVVVMYGGRVVEDAPTAELFAAPRHPYTRALIDSVPTHWSRAGVGRGLSGRFERKNLPPGCPFAPRCRFAVERCRQERQSLRLAGPGHAVACWRADEIEHIGLEQSDDGAEQPQEFAAGLKVSSLACGYGASRGFGGRQRGDAVVRDVSFEIGRGETVALVGESGSGKSTIARTLAGLLTLQGGEVSFEGAPLAPSVHQRSREQLRSVQLIFQNPDASLNPRQTIGRIIGRALTHFFCLRSEEIKERTQELLAAVALDERLVSRYPSELSGGERQRVAIARALAAKPSLLLCDEVLSALDVSAQASMVSLLRKLQAEYSFSMLFISHDLAVVRWLAHRVVVLYRGEMCELATTEQLFSSPLHPYSAMLLSSIPGASATRGSALSVATATLSGTGLPGRGCVASSRCPFRVGEICDRVSPPELLDEEGRRVRCHLPLDELKLRMRDLAGPQEPGAARAGVIISASSPPENTSRH